MHTYRITVRKLTKPSLVRHYDVQAKTEADAVRWGLSVTIRNHWSVESIAMVEA